MALTGNVFVLYLGFMSCVLYFGIPIQGLQGPVKNGFYKITGVLDGSVSEIFQQVCMTHLTYTYIY